VEEGGASLIVLPFIEGLMLSYRLDFGNLSSLRQSFSLLVTEASFIKELSSSRTFGLTGQIEEFQRLGLGMGVTDENCFLIDKNGYAITPVERKPASLRYTDEPVRHKVLDLMGDLYLTGVKLKARVFGVKSGHALNVKMARRLYSLIQKEPSLKTQGLEV
jgi:UDP-3-O-acyl-N-acetylglucosamine deacetylase